MPKALWLLIIGMVVNVTGSSFLWPLNTIYIHDILGKSLSVAGVVLMLNAGASVIGNLAGGFLFDKIGGYKSILFGIIITTLALVGLSIWHDWPYYVVFLTLIGLGSGIVFPSMYAMAGTVWPEGGRRAFNSIYVAQNLGVAIGAALGGWVASYSFQLIFLANTILYIVFFVIALFGYRGIQVERSASTALHEREGSKKDHKLYALMFLCIGYFLCWIGYVQWQTTIAAYTQQLHIPLEKYSFLWAMNGALIVLGQPIVNRLLNYIANSLKKQMILGMMIFIISYLIASTAEQFAAFAAAMVILTIGEMLVWPAVPTVANNLAPVGREGFYQGLVNSTATGGRMVGPLLGGVLVDLYGMSVLFAVLIIFIVMAMVTTSLYDRKMKGGYLKRENASLFR